MYDDQDQTKVSEVNTFVQCRLEKGKNLKDGYVSTSVVLLDMNKPFDVMETDRALRRNAGTEPEQNETCTFLLEMGFNLCKVETDDTTD